MCRVSYLTGRGRREGSRKSSGKGCGGCRRHEARYGGRGLSRGFGGGRERGRGWRSAGRALKGQVAKISDMRVLTKLGVVVGTVVGPCERRVQHEGGQEETTQEEPPSSPNPVALTLDGRVVGRLVGKDVGRDVGVVVGRRLGTVVGSCWRHDAKESSIGALSECMPDFQPGSGVRSYQAWWRRWDCRRHLADRTDRNGHSRTSYHHC